MKISELIEELEEIRKEHGDLEVFVWGYDGQTSYHSPNELEVLDDTGDKELLINA